MREHITHHDDCGCLSARYESQIKIYREGLEKIVALQGHKDRLQYAPAFAKEALSKGSGK